MGKMSTALGSGSIEFTARGAEKRTGLRAQTRIKYPYCASTHCIVLQDQGIDRTDRKGYYRQVERPCRSTRTEDNKDKDKRRQQVIELGGYVRRGARQQIRQQTKRQKPNQHQRVVTAALQQNQNEDAAA